MDRKRHVWLPALGVWAMVGPQGSPHFKRGSLDSNTSHEASPASHHEHASPWGGDDPSRQPTRNDFNACQEPEACSNRDVQEEFCPVCLDLIHASDRAAIVPCLHVFCRPCLRRWAEHQAASSQTLPRCPLCKTAFRSYMVDIRSDRDYRVESIPTQQSSRAADDFGRIR